MQAAVRVSYGILMLLTLAAALPHARRYFLSERWGGYGDTSVPIVAVQNPVAAPLVLLAWFVACGLLTVNRAVVAAAAVNLACCYYFFVATRWRSSLRGMGAPGFIAAWLGAAVFLLELTSRHAPEVRSLALLTLQLDFGAIMLTAGLYKLAAGYRQNHGMELGMANPEWGYWPAFWKSWRPGHPLFRFLDEMAWGTEVACGLLMLIPATRAWGGAGMFLSFVFIATQIRLGFLSEMVMVCCLLFFGAGSLPDGWLAAVWPQPALVVSGTLLPAWTQSALTAALWGYIVLLPFVRAGMFHNQLRHRSWPRPVQWALDAYSNLFGLILWRVFTADVVSFFIRIWEQPEGGDRRLVSHYPRTGPSRFAQVAECIALTTVFTTLKYYPSNRALFDQRLRRYARTIPCPPGSRLVFEWVNLTPRATDFEYSPVAEFTIDPADGTINEVRLTDAVSVTDVPWFSPVHEGARPGSYAPLRP